MTTTPDQARREAAEKYAVDTCVEKELCPRDRFQLCDAFLAGYRQGFKAAKEAAAIYLDEYRKAYAEDLFPPVDMEQFDPKMRTAVAGRMGRFVLDNARKDIRALTIEGEK
jgi:hypothetical protein